MRGLHRPGGRHGHRLLHLFGRLGPGEAHILTVEGLQEPDGACPPIQRAFVEEAAVQCGFCTPGIIMSAVEIVGCGKQYTREELRKLISGHLCRCTGYQNILNAVERAVNEAHRFVGKGE